MVTFSFKEMSVLDLRCCSLSTQHSHQSVLQIKHKELIIWFFLVYEAKNEKNIKPLACIDTRAHTLKHGICLNPEWLSSDSPFPNMPLPSQQCKGEPDLLCIINIALYIECEWRQHSLTYMLARHGLSCRLRAYHTVSRTQCVSSSAFVVFVWRRGRLRCASCLSRFNIEPFASWEGGGSWTGQFEGRISSHVHVCLFLFHYFEEILFFIIHFFPPLLVTFFLIFCFFCFPF